MGFAKFGDLVINLDDVRSIELGEKRFSGTSSVHYKDGTTQHIDSADAAAIREWAEGLNQLEPILQARIVNVGP